MMDQGEETMDTSVGTLPRGTGGHPKRFAFTYAELAEALGKKPQTIRRWVAERRFDPKDFGSVVRLIKAALSRKLPAPAARAKGVGMAKLAREKIARSGDRHPPPRI